MTWKWFSCVGEIGRRSGSQKHRQGVGSLCWKVGVRTAGIIVFVVELRSRWKQRVVRLSCDPDRWSYFEVVSILREMGYMGENELWYCVGGGSVLEDRLEILCDDRGAMNMVTLARLNGEVHLFVMHKMCEPEIIEMLEYFSHDGDGVEGGGNDINMVDIMSEKEIADGVPEPESVHEGEGDRGGETVREGDLDKGVQSVHEVESVHEGERDKGVESLHEGDLNKGDKSVYEEHDNGEDEVVEVNDAEGHDGGQSGKEVDVEKEVEANLDEGVESWNDSGPNDSSDDSQVGTAGLVDINVEGDVEDEHEELVGNIEVEVGGIGEDFGGPSRNWRTIDTADMDSSEGNEYTEEDEGDSEEREGYGRFRTFVMPKRMREYQWEVGTYFSEKGDFVEAIRSYALENSRSLKIVKNDRRRVRVKCLGAKAKCPWLAYCGYMQAVKSWQLRKIVDTHTCSREFNLRLINAKWLSKKVEKTVRQNPRTKEVEIRDEVSRKWNIGISRGMAYRARALATESVEGSFKDQYKRLYDYAHELLKTNPGSTVKLKVKENEGEPIFERFYTCFKACKDNFMSCRPIIGLDGCFLKGKYGGELLTAIGRDGNDQILPIAYAVVEVENKDSWTWFLDLLIEDLGGKQLCGGCTFISYQQKGLLPAIQDLLPGVDQRFCVRHLYADFRKRFPGKNLKRLMWSAASATHPEAWEQEMRKIKEINVEAFKYLIAIPPRYWSRSRFTPSAQSDTIVNNMLKAFNSVLVTTRTKPIIKMLEEIRIYLMNRWAANREKCQRYKRAICPKIYSSWSADKIFEVRHVSQIGDKFVVNIDEASCTCQKWSISGISCCHALSTMKFLGINGQDFISTWFRKSTYEETYSSIIFPINGQNATWSQQKQVLPI
ncbi:uncharacterized protein LOC114166966 [Vigna unguiculata]|uniref:uncharacterized protein LOC114166966 n=1 Tax=Vigna unguiculata TaxID=3917 RepID=UPI001016DFE8|nr:uncharacterized protein LOC114166966 [Vigna unguiculata]